MKKFKMCIIVALLSLTSMPMQLRAAMETTSIAAIKSDDEIKADILLARLDEIKAIDKSDMSRAEKKQLRKETRSIKNQLRELGGGVYLSVGAIIVVILLLILLL
jgi:hypothetical protein